MADPLLAREQVEERVLSLALEGRHPDDLAGVGIALLEERPHLEEAMAGVPGPAVVVLHGFKGFKDWGMFPVFSERLARAGVTAVTPNLSGSGVDDPDAYFYEHYACGSERNYTQYCNAEVDKLLREQFDTPARRIEEAALLQPRIDIAGIALA